MRRRDIREAQQLLDALLLARWPQIGLYGLKTLGDALFGEMLWWGVGPAPGDRWRAWIKWRMADSRVVKLDGITSSDFNHTALSAFLAALQHERHVLGRIAA